MSKIKKDIHKDIDPQIVVKQQKNTKKTIFWVIKNIILFVLLQLFGQLLYATCFTLTIPDARQSMEIFQSIFASTTVLNQAYYFGHFFVLLYIIVKAIANAQANRELGKTTIDKFLTEIDYNPLKNIFQGFNYFTVGLVLQSALTTLISLITILVMGEDASSIEIFFSVSPWSLIVIGICMPLAEELLFRGAILKKLIPIVGEKKANHIQAISYAITHGLTAYSVSDYVMGIILGKMKIMAGSIMAPILAHIGANTLNAIIYTFPNILSYKLFSIVYCIILSYGAGVLLFLLFKSIWNNTKK